MKQYQAYVKGMQFFPPTGMQAIKDEFTELVEDKSIEEVFDVLHTICRAARMPNMFTYVVAYPTAKKHACLRRLHPQSLHQTSETVRWPYLQLPNYTAG